MTGIALAAMLQLSVVSADASYAEAHKAMMETGRPMVILVGAEWCPACRTMKQDVTPGLPVDAWFTPIATGSWELGCSQLCGLGHYRMRALFEVRSETDYRAFVADEVSRLEPPPS